MLSQAHSTLISYCWHCDYLTEGERERERLPDSWTPSGPQSQVVPKPNPIRVPLLCALV